MAAVPSGPSLDSTPQNRQCLDIFMRIRCRGIPFTEQLPSDSPGIVDVFTGRCQATAALHRVTAQRRIYG
jgi:hypothetical protein